MKLTALCILILVAFIAFGCSKKEEQSQVKKSTATELALDKRSIQELIENFDLTYSIKNPEGLKKFFAADADLVLFGTDSAEFNHGIEQIDKHYRDDIQLFATAMFTPPTNVFIEVDSYGEVATALYQTDISGNTYDMKPYRTTLHIMFLLVKQNGEWKIEQGNISAATTGQSSAEQVKKMNTKTDKDTKK